MGLQGQELKDLAAKYPAQTTPVRLREEPTLRGLHLDEGFARFLVRGELGGELGGDRDRLREGLIRCALVRGLRVHPAEHAQAARLVDAIVRPDRVVA
jgi:hypothetical protein